MIKPRADYLFEVSWEVCNKVGGIYAVIKSKLVQILDYYKENYCLIGPYFADKVVGQFQEELPLENLKNIFEELKRDGIICHYGKWLVKGEPKVILIDFTSFKQNLNEIKKELWDNFKIDSLRAPYDYDEPIVWSYAAGKLLEKLFNLFKDKKLIAHFHEWLSGGALLYLKKNDVQIATVFTTHATVLGRTLVENEVDIFCLDESKRCKLQIIDLEKEAYNYNIESKHQFEKVSALNSDVFTTVSEITEIEAQHILGRKADILLPNGLDMLKFPTFEERSIKHKFYKNKIKEFLLYYFFPYYTLDLENSLFYFIAGRYEFHNKGINVFIKALGKLNQRLKKENNKKTIFVFFWIPTGIRGIKPELLENRTFYQDIKDKIEEEMGDIKNNIIYTLVSQKKITKNVLFKEDFLLKIKKSILRLKKTGKPGLTTHDLVDENDIITKYFYQNALRNEKEDKVKVILYPIYLTGADSLLDLDYNQAIMGSHLGVFPSFYEPWGYTPVETAALGVSSVTTDLAGFGRYIIKKIKKDIPGIFIIKRLNKNDDEVIEELFNVLYNFTNLSQQDRIANKIEARRLASLTDWKVLIENYIKAHNMAVERVF
jgi:glycogen(starch) synthase